LGEHDVRGDGNRLTLEDVLDAEDWARRRAREIIAHQGETR
jgi:1-deoxy-D-xylulose-5-phosphate reductoisomerase